MTHWKRPWCWERLKACIYIHIHTHMYIYVYMYMYIFWWTEIFNFNKIQFITYFSLTYHSSGILQTFFPQVVLVVKNLMTNTGEARDAGSIPGSGRFPGGGHGNHSSILSWRIPRREGPGKLESIGSQRVRHNWSDLACMQTFFFSTPTSLKSYYVFFSVIFIFSFRVIIHM